MARKKNKKRVSLFSSMGSIGRRIQEWALRGSRLHRLLKIGLLGVACASIVLALYCLYLSIRIEARFSGRRWSIPSKVLSDTTILYPGQRINQSSFIEKLKRLGYHEVSHGLEEKGEMRTSISTAEIFLHDLALPHQTRRGFRARIRFRNGEIASIENLDYGESVPLLELEPEEIAMLFGPERERRQLVSIGQVSRYLIDAVLSAEDKRFYEHHGIDPKGLARALYTNIVRGGVVQGGSTITQQLAKCYFLYPERTVIRKFQEALMALVMELMYQKNQILEIYLNEIYLGQKGSVSINGVGEASYFYFGKSVSDLTLPEAAVIAGLIKAPNRYSPYVDKDRCLEQRNRVLRAMYNNGWISRQELDEALNTPIVTAGMTDFGRRAPYFVDYLKEQLASLYSAQSLASLGLSIYTTLDTQVQMAAERALERGLVRLEKARPGLERADPAEKLQGAVIVIQPKTGYVLAMVGGRDYGITQFNRATQARRQPGSAFKPFVYLSGLDRFTPISRLSNRPVSYENDGQLWEPKNFELMPENSLTLRDALAKSVNLATVDLAMQVGIDHVIDTAESFGFSTPFKPVPALSLGACEVIPLELARAYCAFAAEGVLPYPLSLKEVVNDKGVSLESRHMTIANVISPAKAYIMTSLLRSVVTEGTARSLGQMGISFPVAGKTGTTNDFRDAWFVGYTPQILALIWVGFDDQTSVQATGSTAALPIWADLMNSIPQYTSGDWFEMPAGVVERVVCLDSGELAVRACPNKKKEVFLEGTAPNRYCSLHGNKDFMRQIWKNGKNIIDNL